MRPRTGLSGILKKEKRVGGAGRPRPGPSSRPITGRQGAAGTFMQLRVAFLRLAYTVWESREVGGSNQWAIFSTRKEGGEGGGGVWNERALRGRMWRANLVGSLLGHRSSHVSLLVTAPYGLHRSDRIAFIVISSGECPLRIGADAVRAYRVLFSRLVMPLDPKDGTRGSRGGDGPVAAIEIEVCEMTPQLFEERLGCRTRLVLVSGPSPAHWLERERDRDW
ncbi:hypothetical protein NL676_015020 [Syzygium grande]|nr:hypothetical protein NL676_015020 [Syzygium grande]